MKNKIACFECQEGHYKPMNQVYETLLGDGNILTVPDIDVLTCVKCGDECLDSKNSIKIDKAREAYRINK